MSKVRMAAHIRAMTVSRAADSLFAVIARSVHEAVVESRHSWVSKSLWVGTEHDLRVGMEGIVSVRSRDALFVAEVAPLRKIASSAMAMSYREI